jgi:hypothetical protein
MLLSSLPSLLGCLWFLADLIRDDLPDDLEEFLAVEEALLGQGAALDLGQDRLDLLVSASWIPCRPSQMATESSPDPLPSTISGSAWPTSSGR